MTLALVEAEETSEMQVS